MRGRESIPQDGFLPTPAWALVVMQNETLLLRCLPFAFQVCKYQLHSEHVIKTNDLCLPLLCLAHKESGQIRENERDRWVPAIVALLFQVHA